MNKRRLTAAVAISLAFLMLTAVGVFAYFRITKSLDKDIGVGADDTGRVEIASFSDLFAYSVNPTYNDPSSSSGDAARHTLYLTADIKLDEHIFIGSDCHIDLGGKTLDLNGHTMTISHAYTGTTVISGGTVDPYDDSDTAVAGALVIDTPSSTVTLDGVTFLDPDGNETENVFTEILWQTENADHERYAAYNALYTVANALVTGYDNRPARLTYSEVLALDELSLEAVLPYRTYCSYLTGEGEICTFTERDLDLPEKYLSSDVTITYSSGSDALSAKGNVTLPDTLSTANLTVTVTAGSTTVTDTVAVHIYNPDDTATALGVAESLILSRLSEHYRESDGVHVLNRGIYLPKQIGGVNVGYRVFEDAEMTVEVPDSDLLTDVSDGVVNLEPTTESKMLRITLTRDGESRTLNLPMLSGNTGIITTNASLAQNLAQSWYGGRVVITPQLKEPEHTVIGYNPVHLFPHTADLETKYGITDVRYTLMNNSYDVYEIIEKILKVKSGKDPSLYVQGVMLNCIFTFGDEGDEEIQVEIYYDAQGTGNNINEFLPYYTYFNELIYGELAGSTTKDFSLSLAYSNTGPFICYDMRVYNAESGEYELGKPSFMDIELYYNDAVRHTFTEFDGSVSMTELLDAYLTANTLTLDDLVAYGDAAWHFALDTDAIPHTNTAIDLIYNYKMTSDVNAWLRYPNGELEPTTSALYIAGILHHAEDDVPDEALYEWIYNTFNITGATYSGNEFIVVDWLLQNVTIDYNDTDSTFPDNVENFKGLEFLTGVKYLDLSDHPSLSTAEGAANAAVAISGMTGLETLKLSNNAFRDKDNAASADNGTLSSFASLDNVKYLYIDGNDIFTFEWLKEMEALEEVYLYGNSDSDDFTSLVKIFYGSEGLVNLEIFRELTDVGVAVYNVFSDPNCILFEDVPGINDFIRLSSVEYQKKLAEGADITALYAGLSTNAEDYGLATSYEGINYGFEHVLVFGYIGDDPTTATAFTLTDNITVEDQIEVAVTVVFEIIRV